MAGNYTVKQGDHIAKIAESHGFRTFFPIWEHPNNEPLRALRGSPHILLPGDVVYVPDRVERVEVRPTGKVHTFKLVGQRLVVRVALLDDAFEPIPRVPCDVEIDGASSTETDDSGVATAVIRKQAEEGTLHAGDLLLPLRVGHLDPADTTTGVAARLNALGYDAGEGADPAAAQFRSAVEEFQCDRGLEVTGDVDTATQTQLAGLHGC